MKQAVEFHGLTKRLAKLESSAFNLLRIWAEGNNFIPSISTVFYCKIKNPFQNLEGTEVSISDSPLQ